MTSPSLNSSSPSFSGSKSYRAFAHGVDPFAAFAAKRMGQVRSLSPVKSMFDSVAVCDFRMRLAPGVVARLRPWVGDKPFRPFRPAARENGTRPVSLAKRCVRFTQFDEVKGACD